MKLDFKYKWWYTPILLSLLLGTLFLYLLPDPFNKNKIEHTASFLKHEKDNFYFVDYDNDGYSENVRVRNSFDEESPSISFCEYHEYDLQRNIQEQYNFTSLWNFPRAHLLQHHDIDGDNKQEIYLIAVKNDSAFLIGFEPNTSFEPFIVLPISTYPKGEKPLFIDHSNFVYVDLNDDGTKEIIFNIRNGYPVVPRRMVAVDLVNEDVLLGPETALKFGQLHHQVFNGKNYFTGSNYATGNYHGDPENLLYSDYSAWGLLYSDSFKIQYPPFELRKFKSKINQVFISAGESLLACFPSNSDSVALMRMDFTGKLLKSKVIRNSRYFKAIIGPRDHTFYLASDRSIVLMDTSLVVLDEFISDKPFPLLETFDLDNDGSKEFVLHKKNKPGLFILDNNFNILSKIESHKLATGSAHHFMKRNIGENNSQLVILKNGIYEFLDYTENPLYNIRFLYILGVYGSLFLLLYYSMLFSRKSIEKKHMIEKKLLSHQLLALKNQVDPHFTLNALNSIDYMYQNNEGEKAGRYMVKLSRLIHQTLAGSDKMVYSLEEEFDFIEAFLQLETERSEGKIEYNINTPDELDLSQIEIPKQVVFTFVENAVKHGLRPKESKGILELNIKHENSHYTIEIEDNGIGFDESRKQKTSTTRKGLKIADELISLYRDLRKVQIHKEVTSSTAGTLVKLIIPRKEQKMT